MKVPHPIPYQGSKRQIAAHILSFFPHEISTLIEPFAGSAAISIAAACYGKSSRFHLNDVNHPLMALWNQMINNPKAIAEKYEQLWNEQQDRAREFYDEVRDKFNRNHEPDLLLYLLARCVKASVRYNPKGEFNQSPDNRRLGRHPQRMAEDIYAVSNLFRERTIVTSKDYREVLKYANSTDLVYMDPPYQGVCSNGDSRYYSGIELNEFVEALVKLNKKGVPFILSYDGRTGDKSFGQELPLDLELHRIEIDAGRSSQSTLLGRSEVTFESIYLSLALTKRLRLSSVKLPNVLVKKQPRQLELLNS